MKKILVLCTGNSCRSQIAEAYLRLFALGRADVYSAGIVANGVNPRVIDIMNEDGIGISQHTSNLIEEYADLVFDYVITVCDNAKERCPFFPAAVNIFHRNFFDPTHTTGTELEINEQFRIVRNQIKDYCKDLISKILI